MAQNIEAKPAGTGPVTDGPSSPGATLTQRQIYMVFAGVMAGLALSALDGTIVSTALATIIGDLGGIKYYAWVGTAYMLTSTTATPLFGKLSDDGKRQCE